MFLTALTGSVLGLLVSTLVRDIRTALNIIPLLLIPQIILGGALIKYEEMNRNLDFVYSIRHWVEKKEGAEAEPASKLKVPFICHFMPLRWSYESTIISQAKLNPLSVAQSQLEDRIQEFANLPRHIPLTEKQRKDMDLAKQALAVVSGLSGEDANVVGDRLALIRKGLQSGRLDPSLLEARSKKGVSADEIYVNQKVLDLVNKAEMEREDYRRKESPNVFFGTVKTYHPFGKPDDSAATHTELTRDTPAPKKLWYEEFKISTLWMNFFVIIFGLAVVVVFLMIALKRQLSKV
jgi:hypothetical protein